jgi:superfamily II DNA or RNA helicase
MAELFVKVQSHHYVCKVVTPLARGVVERFGKRFVQYGMERRGRQIVHAPLKVFGSRTSNSIEYRYHINTLGEFKKHIAGNNFGPNFAVFETAELPLAVEVKFKTRPYKLSDEEQKDPLALFEYQEEAVDYVVEGTPPKSKLIGIQTGKGKGMISMFSMSRIGMRPLILVKPSFVEKWVDEIVDIIDIDPKEIMVVRSTKHLHALILMALEGEFHSKIVVMNNTIFRNWIKSYEMLHEGSLDVGYGCYPDEFMAIIGAGLRLIDEVHMDFFLNFMIDLFTHCQRSLSLSATLMSKDDFMNMMYDIAYPTQDRFAGLAYDKYANVTALLYRFKDPEKIRYQDPTSKNYTHNLFEQSVMKRPEVLANYLKLIDGRVQHRYLKNYQPGERAIIFAASIDLCTYITDYLKQKYPHLDIRRYVEDDPYENVIEADLRVTTIGSGGTAIDIPNLVYALMTTSISSVQANLQALGRLRKLRTGKTPEFDYLVNADNPKQMDYHVEKGILLKTRALTLSTEWIHQLV